MKIGEKAVCDPEKELIKFCKWYAHFLVALSHVICSPVVLWCGKWEWNWENQLWGSAGVAAVCALLSASMQVSPLLLCSVYAGSRLPQHSNTWHGSPWRQFISNKWCEMCYTERDVGIDHFTQCCWQHRPAKHLCQTPDRQTCPCTSDVCPPSYSGSCRQTSSCRRHFPTNHRHPPAEQTKIYTVWP